jgi:hypothetical protein
MNYTRSIVLCFILAFGISYSATSAEKLYSKETALDMCATGINSTLDDLAELAKLGKTTTEMQDAVATKDPEMRGLIQKFIAEVMNEEFNAADITLKKALAVCVKKLSDIEV